jgi:hypothetical protein
LEGLQAVVQLLVDRGADVNAQGGEYGSAFRAAILTDNEAAVQLLVDLEANSTPRAATTATLSRQRYWRATTRWSSCWWINGGAGVGFVCE